MSSNLKCIITLSLFCSQVKEPLYTNLVPYSSLFKYRPAPESTSNHYRLLCIVPFSH